MSMEERKKSASQSDLLELDIESDPDMEKYSVLLKSLPQISKPDWSRPLWIFLYTILSTYPDKPTQETQQYLYNFLISLQAIMPCHTCAEHFLAHLSSPNFKDALTSRYNFAKWIFHVHNDINLRTGKPTLSFEQSVDVVSQMITWPREWDMPTPRVEPDGSMRKDLASKRNTARTNIRYMGASHVMNKFWWVGLLSSILLISIGFGIGFAVKSKSR